MPYLMDTSSRLDDVVQAIVTLIERDGIEALTIRRIAGEVRISPSTLTSHLTNKERIVDLTLKRTADCVRRAISLSLWQHRGIPAFVPDEEHLPWFRAWLALNELARSNERLGSVVDHLDGELRALLEHACPHPVDDETALLVLAVVRGLWWEMCDRADPMPSAQARALLVAACSRLGLELRDAA